jgi:hypothetical protein
MTLCHIRGNASFEQIDEEAAATLECAGDNGATTRKGVSMTIRHPKTWWGIRHLRWSIYNMRVHRWARQWSELGVGLGAPNAADLQMLDAIWRGEA